MRVNPLVANLATPPVPEVQRWAKAYDGDLGPGIDLSQAVPGYPPHPDLLAWLAEAAGSAACAGYGPIEGEAPLRHAYASHQAELYGADLAAANVHITSGCNQAFVTAAMTVAGAGDSLLLTDPYYFNHETTLAMLGIGVRYVSCTAANGFLPKPEAVAAAIGDDIRALALVSPNNPTGAVYPPDLLSELFDLCDRRGIWLILDETYRDFLLPGEGPPHGLFSRRSWENTFISLYSFSKSFCIPGHRLGAVTAGEGIVGHVAGIMDNLQICAPRAPQVAVARGLPALTGWREANRREIAARADVLRDVMAAAPGWRLDAVGAYFAFARHPFSGKDSREVAEALACKAGVLTIPGGFFGAGQDDYLRIAFANADADGLHRFADRLTRFSL